MAREGRADLHKALAHPLRRELLALARRRDEFSPVELAQEVPASLGTVSYHVRLLAEAGLIELCGTSFRRGAVRHHYRVREAGAAGISEVLRLAPATAEALSRDVAALVARARSQVTQDGVDVAIHLEVS